jgi:hypothetical protein
MMSHSLRLALRALNLFALKRPGRNTRQYRRGAFLCDLAALTPNLRQGGG